MARWSPFRVYNQEITIVGSMAVLHSFERAADLFAAGVLDASVIVTDRVPLTDYPAAIAASAPAPASSIRWCRAPDSCRYLLVADGLGCRAARRVVPGRRAAGGGSGDLG